MNKTSAILPASCMHRAGRHDGFTLVELMIAMLLGLIVIAGVTSVFLANLRAYHTSTALGQVESSSRIAYELMARDIRQAGANGCNSVSGRLVNVLKNGPANGGTEWWANWNNALHGYDDASDDPAVAASAGSSIQLLFAGGSPVAIKKNNTGATTFKLEQTTDNVQNGDIIVACSPDHAAIMQISAMAAGGDTITYAANTGTPGNCTSNLGYPNTDCTGALYEFPRGSLISKLHAVDWYVADNAAGTSSLYRATLTNTTGTPAITSSEMVRGVTSMNIEYLPAGASSTYQNATWVTNGGHWGDVTAVRVTLKMRSKSDHASTDGSPVERTYSFTTALRNRLN